MTSFTGWSLLEAAGRTTATGANKDEELWRFVESGRLLAYGRRNAGSSREWIVPRECSSLLYRNFESSSAASADAKKKPIQDILLYPTLHAPHAAEFVDGVLLREVIAKFVSGDPEVQNLARKVRFGSRDKSVYLEDLRDHVGPIAWRLVFEKGFLGGRRDEVEEYFSSPVPRELQEASDTLELRFHALLHLLRSNELHALGDPARSTDPHEIPVGLWSYDQYYWDQKNGDLLQLNHDADGPLAPDFIPRWRAVVVRKPGSTNTPPRRASFGLWTLLEELSKAEEAVFISIKQLFPSGLAGIKPIDRNRAIRKFCEQASLSVPSEQTIKRALRKMRFDPG